MSKKLQEFINKQVEETIELIFANAHGMAMTDSGDITPTQQGQLDEIKEDLKQLIHTQVIQNLDVKKVHVAAYNNDIGVFWKVCLGDETVDDGFESTADAEMWARDNGYTVVSLEKEHYRVTMCRTGYGFTTIDVMARSQEEAEDKALDEAGNHEYSEKTSEYTTDGATKL